MRDGPEATASRRIVLASGSPRRRDLLIGRFGEAAVRVVPPSSAEELSFDGLDGFGSIVRRLELIAKLKADDVSARLSADDDWDVLIASDTTVVVASDGRPVALANPPEDETYAATVREWFARFYLGRSHEVLTAFRIMARDGRTVAAVEPTRVTFRDASAEEVDRYIATGEPRGKAGGYAIQGLGASFVTRVEGDLSNVIGLPVAAVAGAIGRLVSETTRAETG